MRKTNLNSNVREQYVSPGMKILSLQSEGVLCGSTGDANEPGNPLSESDDYIYNL